MRGSIRGFPHTNNQHPLTETYGARGWIGARRMKVFGKFENKELKLWLCWDTTVQDRIEMDPIHIVKDKW